MKGLESELLLEIVDCEAEKGYISYRNPSTQRVYRIHVPSLEKDRVEDMRELFQGIRDEEVLWVLARCVGYFAFMHNMGKSRFQEVTDRRKGAYDFPGEINNNPIGHVMKGLQI